MKILVLISLFILVSCVEKKIVSQPDSKDSKNDNDNVITLSVFPDFNESCKILIKEFERENPDWKVELIVKGIGNHHFMIMDNITKGKPLPEVLMVEDSFLDSFSFAFENLLEEPYNAKKLKENFIPYKWTRALTKDKELVAMPLDVSPACVWYRKDIFEERNFGIKMIEDLEDLYKAGKILTFDKNEDGKIDHYLLPDAKLIFEMILLSSGESFFDKNGRPNLNTPKISRAMQWAKKFRKAGYDAKIEEWSMEWYKGLLEGTFAYVISGFWLGKHLENWIAPNKVNKFRVAQLPKLTKKDSKRMNYNKGGSFLAIPKKTPENKKLIAYELIKFLTTRKESQILNYQKGNLLPVKLDAWEDKIFDEGIEYIGGQKVKKLWKEMSLEIPEVNVNINNFYARRQLFNALKNVLEKDADINEELKNAELTLESNIR